MPPPSTPEILQVPPAHMLYVKGYEPAHDAQPSDPLKSLEVPKEIQDHEVERGITPEWQQNEKMANSSVAPPEETCDVSAHHSKVVDNQTLLHTVTGSKFTVKQGLNISCFNTRTGLRQCLPSLVYIGVGHAGSTALFQALAMHPQLVPNDVQKKGKPGREPWFFNNMWNLNWDVDQAREEYAALFPQLSEKPIQALYEKTVTYWRNLAVPARMALVVPNATLLMFLRNPTSWLHSRFYPIHLDAPERTMKELLDDVPEPNSDDIARADDLFRRRLDTEGFKMCTDLPSRVKEILLHYPRSSLQVELAETFLKDPVSVLKRIENSIGLQPYTWNETQLTSNRWHVQVRPSLSSNLRTYIKQQCHSSIAEVEKLLNMDIQGIWDAAEAM